MELRQLEHLVAVMDAGSMGKAARALGLTQPALTQSLRRLERSLDVSLLQRGARGVEATEAGRLLVERARAVGLETRRAVAELDALAARVRGTLTVGCGPSLAATLVPAAVARLIVEYPRLRVTLREGTLDVLMPALEQGAVDLAVGTRPDTRAQRGMESRTLLRDRIVIAARAGHPLARRRVNALADTLRFAWILPAEGDVVRTRIGSIFTAAGLAPPLPVVQTNSTAAIRALLQGGDFLTFVPARLLGHAGGDALCEVRVTGGDWTREVHVLSRAGALQPAGRLFVSILSRLCEDEGDAPATERGAARVGRPAPRPRPASAGRRTAR